MLLLNKHKSMKHIRTLYATVVASVSTPLVAFAQFTTGGPYYGGIGGGYTVGVPSYAGAYGGGGSYYGQTRSNLQFNNIQSLIGLANTLLGYIQVIIFLVALFYFLWAAYDFVTGNVKAGTPKLGYAALGIVVAILAFSIIPLICFLTSAQNGPACQL